MRRTLLFGGLESLAHNINRRSANLAFYEFGNVYSKRADAESTAERPLTPYVEGARMALWMTGDRRSANWSRPAEESTFYDLKAAVLNVFARLGIAQSAVTMKPAKAELYGAALSVDTRNGKHLGTMGLVNPKIAAALDVKQPVAYAEFDWNALVALATKNEVIFTELPKTQAVKRDLALLLDKAVSFAQVEDVIRQSERRLLRDVTLFDVYEGDKLPTGKKSYAVTILLQDNEKTLQDKYVDQVMNKIITNLGKQLGAELR